MSGNPIDLLKNYLGALSRSTVLPRKIPRPAVSISREGGAGALTVPPRPGLLREYARETNRKMTASGNVILVGRGAAVISAGLPHVLRVRLVASFEFRVRNFARSHGIPEQEAVRVVRTNERISHRENDVFGRTEFFSPTNLPYLQ